MYKPAGRILRVSAVAALNNNKNYGPSLERTLLDEFCTVPDSHLFKQFFLALSKTESQQEAQKVK